MPKVEWRFNCWIDGALQVPLNDEHNTLDQVRKLIEYLEEVKRQS